MNPTGLPERETARALLIDPDDRLLLIAYQAARAVDPARPGKRDFWYTPGGGREPGESLEQTCLRELEEETGLTGLTLGPHIARRAVAQTLFARKRFVRETYFLVRAPHARIDISRLQETEGDLVLDVRWWSLDALRAPGLVIEPPTIVALFADILAGQVPVAPRDLAPG
jgi:8-oxo-dGTP pyrophosphatase MutT (NUDIX family)